MIIKIKDIQKELKRLEKIGIRTKETSRKVASLLLTKPGMQSLYLNNIEDFHKNIDKIILELSKEENIK